MLAVGQVIGVHYRSDVRFLNCCFERGQIDFAHGSLVDYGVGVVPVEFGIVSHEVLDGCTYTLVLHALDVSHREPRGEKRIFAEVLKIAAVHGREVDVDAGSEHEMNPASACITADFRAHLLGQRNIPSSGERDAAGHRSGRTVIAGSQRSVGRFQARESDGGDRADEKAIDAAEQVDFFFQG